MQKSDEFACVLAMGLSQISLQQELHPKENSELRNQANSAIFHSTFGQNGDMTEAVMDSESDLNLNAHRREEEQEVDLAGAMLAGKCGYDPYALCDFYQRLAEGKETSFAQSVGKATKSISDFSDRAKKLKKALDAAKAQSSGKAVDMDSEFAGFKKKFS